jgi:nicotinamidase-related amidase
MLLGTLAEEFNLNTTKPVTANTPAHADGYSLKKRTTIPQAQQSSQFQRTLSEVTWDPQRTAVIVCDVWDYHHCKNAVKRLDQMLPRMESVLEKTRRAGSVIIHAPSDCMPYYSNHPARDRVASIPLENLPNQIASWNCRLEKELSSLYPLDQSDGGEDDQPEEHKAWAGKLTALGRNPNLPWKAQNPALSIDATKDYISDRGDEVWAILKHHRIQHVIMIGVHTNMCVLGRPFGLRQLKNNGMDVVLVRDLTDCMYNPKRWPYVDHYSGNDLMISYIEQTVCPTISSDQILGGKPVVFSEDKREKLDLLPHEIFAKLPEDKNWEIVQWKTVAENWFGGDASKNQPAPTDELWLRCSLRVPPKTFNAPVSLYHPRIRKAWLNGNELERSKQPGKTDHFEIQSAYTFGNDDANVLVIALDVSNKSQMPVGKESQQNPLVISADQIQTLGGGWQQNRTPDSKDNNLPLPAKFALPPAVFYTLP